jgi:hypothetical protein
MGRQAVFGRGWTEPAHRHLSPFGPLGEGHRTAGLWPRAGNQPVGQFFNFQILNLLNQFPENGQTF